MSNNAYGLVLGRSRHENSPGRSSTPGIFFENAHGSHGTNCSSVMVVDAWSNCSGQHFQFFRGIGIPSLFLCLEGAF